MAAKEYKVLDVKEWPNSEHPTYGSKLSVSFEGEGEPVDMTAKKFPVKGEIEYGEITDYYTKNGTARRKFKRKDREEAVAERAQTAFQKGFDSTKSDKPDEAYWQSKNDQIKAQWAIGQAVRLYIPQLTGQNRFDEEELESWAKELYAMVDRVAGSTSVAEELPKTGIERARQVAEETRANKLATTLDNGEPMPVDTTDYSQIDTDQPIDISDIPF